MIAPGVDEESGRCERLHDDDPCDHPRWEHPEGFGEILESLARGLDVHDSDGALVLSAVPEDTWFHRVTWRDGADEKSYLTMDPEQFLVQDRGYDERFEEAFENLRRNYRRTHEAHGGQEGARRA